MYIPCYLVHFGIFNASFIPALHFRIDPTLLLLGVLGEKNDLGEAENLSRVGANTIDP